ncbi:hypothetical protein SDC9_130862 [bioreactor metagenome]|uniref:Uncharacterized protein n=1 Tax=bioreactor metagenome TaxID=1076179 RepID=A0A645D3V4_9ZZZZ
MFPVKDVVDVAAVERLHHLRMDAADEHAGPGEEAFPYYIYESGGADEIYQRNAAQRYYHLVALRQIAEAPDELVVVGKEDDSGYVGDVGLAVHRLDVVVAPAQLAVEYLREVYVELRRFKDKDKHRELYPDHDRHRKVEYHRTDHRDEELQHRALEAAGEYLLYRVPLVHAPGRHHQHPGERGERQRRHHGTEEEHRGKQSDPVEYAGEPRLAAGFYRDARARDRRRRGNAA